MLLIDAPGLSLYMLWCSLISIYPHTISVRRFCRVMLSCCRCWSNCLLEIKSFFTFFKVDSIRCLLVRPIISHSFWVWTSMVSFSIWRFRDAIYEVVGFRFGCSTGNKTGYNIILSKSKSLVMVILEIRIFIYKIQRVKAYIFLINK